MSRLTSRPTRQRTRTNLGNKFYRLKKRYGYYPIGAVIEPPPNVADMLLKQDIIEELENPTDKPVEFEKIDEDQPVKRKRGRPRKNPEE